MRFGFSGQDAQTEAEGGAGLRHLPNILTAWSNPASGHGR